MRILFKALVVSLLISTFFSCDKKDTIDEEKLTNLLPIDAKAVVGVNLSSMKDKAGKAIFSKENKELQQVFENTAYAYFTLLQNKDEAISVVGLARLVDTEEMKTKLGSVIKTTDEVELFSLTQKVKRLNSEKKVVESEEVYGYAGIKNNMLITVTAPNMEVIDEQVIDKIPGYFIEKKERLLDKEPTLVNVLAKNKDFAIWMSGDFKINKETFKSLPRELSSVLEGINMEGSYTSGTINFEKGAVVADYFFQGNEAYKEKIEKITKDHLESSTIDLVKIIDPSVFVSFALDSKKTLLLLKETDKEQEFTKKLKEYGLGLDAEAFFELINGDIALALANINLAQYEVDAELLIGVESEKKAKNFLDLLVAQGTLNDEKDRYSYLVFGMMKLLIDVQDNTIIITKDNNFGRALLKGEKDTNISLKEKLEENAVVVFIDPSALPAQMVLSPEDIVHLKKIESIDLTVKKGDNGTGTAGLNINFKDKAQNVLQLLNEVE